LWLILELNGLKLPRSGLKLHELLFAVFFCNANNGLLKSVFIDEEGIEVSSGKEWKRKWFEGLFLDWEFLKRRWSAFGDYFSWIPASVPPPRTTPSGTAPG